MANFTSVAYVHNQCWSITYQQSKYISLHLLSALWEVEVHHKPIYCKLG